MAEGFYFAADNPNLSKVYKQHPNRYLRVILPVVELHYKLCESEAEADKWSGLQMGPSGVDIYRWGLTQSELDALDLSEDGPDWARGHLHELIEHLSKGGTLPFKTKMKGGSAATLISNQGHLITNQHLVPGIQHFHEFPEQTVVPDGVPMSHHSIKTASGVDLGPVRLVYVDSSIDLAILKLDTIPSQKPVVTRDKRVERHERVWHWGYPQMTRRPTEQRAFLGYSNIERRQVYSVGLVLTDPSQSEWFTDADSALGMSGASVLDDDGCIVGLFWGGGAGGGSAASLPKSERYRYRRVVDIHRLKERLAQFFV